MRYNIKDIKKKVLNLLPAIREIQRIPKHLKGVFLEPTESHKNISKSPILYPK